MCDKLFSKKKLQKVIVPQGLVRENETTVIEIPEEYKDEPVVVVTAKPSTCPADLNYSNTTSGPYSGSSYTSYNSPTACPGLLNDSQQSDSVFFPPRGSTPCLPNQNPNVSTSTANESLGLLNQSELNNTSFLPQVDNPNENLGLLNESQLNNTSLLPPRENVPCYINNESLGLLPTSLLNNTSFGSQKRTQSCLNESMGILHESQLNNTQFSTRPQLNLTSQSTGGCNVTCPNVSQQTSSNYSNQTGSLPNESLGLLNESALNSINIRPISPQGISIAGRSYQTNCSNACPNVTFHSGTSGGNRVHENLGLLHSSVINGNVTPPNLSQAAHSQNANDSLGILGPHQIQTSFGTPPTVHTISRIVITTTSNNNDASLGLLNASQLANNTFNTNDPSLGLLGLEHMQNLSGSPQIGTRTMYSTASVGCQSGCSALMGRRNFSTSTPNNFATSTPNKSNSPVPFTPCPSFELEQSLDYSDEGHPNVVNLSAIPHENVFTSPPQNANISRNVDENLTSQNANTISRALDEHLRVTEEREQTTLQKDLKNYQEARRRLVTDTTKFSNFNKGSESQSP